MFSMLRGIVRQEGLPVLWRGLDAAMLISLPMVGIYMPLYDYLQQQLSAGLRHSGLQDYAALAPAVAAGAARTVAVFAVAPLELVRTRQQALQTAAANGSATSGAGASAWQALASLARDAAATGRGSGQGGEATASASGRASCGRSVAGAVRGLPQMWRGFYATLLRDVPFSAAYFSAVEPLRAALLRAMAEHQHGQQHDVLDVLGASRCVPAPQGAAAGCSTVPAAAAASSSSSSIRSAVGGGDWEVVGWDEDGPLELYRRHQAGAAAAQPAPADGCQDRSASVSCSSASSSSASGGGHPQGNVFLANLVAGASAGAVASALTTPFDVVKTRMQTDGGAGRGVQPGTWETFRGIYRAEGWRGLFAGVAPRTARSAPACAIVIASYEVLKNAF